MNRWPFLGLLALATGCPGGDDPGDTDTDALSEIDTDTTEDIAWEAWRVYGQGTFTWQDLDDTDADTDATLVFQGTTIMSDVIVAMPEGVSAVGDGEYGLGDVLCHWEWAATSAHDAPPPEACAECTFTFRVDNAALDKGTSAEICDAWYPPEDGHDDDAWERWIGYAPEVVRTVDVDGVEEVRTYTDVTMIHYGDVDSETEGEQPGWAPSLVDRAAVLFPEDERLPPPTTYLPPEGETPGTFDWTYFVRLFSYPP